MDGAVSAAPVWYLKDWHCFRDHPAEDFYRVPHLLCDDWLNWCEWRQFTAVCGCQCYRRQ